MSLYKDCFGSNFELGFDLNTYPFLEDISWQNDVSPSFVFEVHGSFYRLWVDYEDHNRREFEGVDRYAICEYRDEELDEHIEDIEISENFEDIIKVFKSLELI